jgi:hypothetical protein
MAEEKKSKNFFKEYIFPMISVLIICAFTWIFFTRVDKIESAAIVLNESVVKLSNSVAKLETLVGVMDKALDVNASSHVDLYKSIADVKTEVSSIVATVEMLKSRIH